MKYQKLLKVIEDSEVYDIMIPTEIVVKKNGNKVVLTKTVKMTKKDYINNVKGN